VTAGAVDEAVERLMRTHTGKKLPAFALLLSKLNDIAKEDRGEMPDEQRERFDTSEAGRHANVTLMQTTRALSMPEKSASNAPLKGDSGPRKHQNRARTIKPKDLPKLSAADKALIAKLENETEEPQPSGDAAAEVFD